MAAILSTAQSSFEISRAFVANHDTRTKQMTDKATFGTQVALSFRTERANYGAGIAGTGFQSVLMTVFSGTDQVDKVDFCTFHDNTETRRYEIQCQFPKIIIKYNDNPSYLTVRIISIEVRSDLNFDRILRLFEGLSLRYRPFITTKGLQIPRGSTASPFAGQSSTSTYPPFRNAHTASPVPAGFQSQSDFLQDRFYSPTSQPQWSTSPPGGGLQESIFKRTDGRFNQDLGFPIDPAMSPSLIPDRSMMPPLTSEYKQLQTGTVVTLHGPSPLSKLQDGASTGNVNADASSASQSKASNINDMLPPTRTLPFETPKPQRHKPNAIRSGSSEDSDEIEESEVSSKALVSSKKGSCKKATEKDRRGNAVKSSNSKSNKIKNNGKNESTPSPLRKRKPTSEPSLTVKKSHKKQSPLPPVKKSRKIASRAGSSQAKETSITKDEGKQADSGTSKPKGELSVHNEEIIHEILSKLTPPEPSDSTYFSQAMLDLLMTPTIMFNVIEEKAPWMFGVKFNRGRESRAK